MNRHSELATADYVCSIMAIFVVRTSFPVAESPSTPHLSRHTVCLASQWVTLHEKRKAGPHCRAVRWWSTTLEQNHSSANMLLQYSHLAGLLALHERSRAPLSCHAYCCNTGSFGSVTYEVTGRCAGLFSQWPRIQHKLTNLISKLVRCSRPNIILCSMQILRDDALEIHRVMSVLRSL
jgi:hypothetical protein